MKIQGAENIAKAGIKAYLLQHDKSSVKKLLSARPTEPMLQNIVSILEKEKNPGIKAEEILRKIKEDNKKIAENGARIIKNNLKIFTHCHSSSVVSVLLKAKKQGKKFIVYNTETHPLLQGRRTARELAKAGIRVINMEDDAVLSSLKECDIFIFGADAITPKGIVNKIGTGMFAELAFIHKIPGYCVSSSLKFTKKIKIEFRNPREVWNEREKNITVINPAFDFTSRKYVKSIICEKGVLSFKKFLKFKEIR